MAAACRDRELCQTNRSTEFYIPPFSFLISGEVVKQVEPISTRSANLRCKIDLRNNNQSRPVSLDVSVSEYQEMRQISREMQTLLQTLQSTIDALTRAAVPLNPARTKQFELLGLDALFATQVEKIPNEKQLLEVQKSCLARAAETNTAALSSLAAGLRPVCYSYLKEKGQISAVSAVYAYVAPHDVYIQQYAAFKEAEDKAAATAAAPLAQDSKETATASGNVAAALVATETAAAPMPTPGGAAAASVQLAPASSSTATQETGLEKLDRFYRESEDHRATSLNAGNKQTLVTFVRETRGQLEHLRKNSNEKSITQTHEWRKAMTSLNQLGDKLGLPRAKRITV